MSDILGTDLQLTDDFDLSIADGDLELASGKECLKQDILTGIATPLMLWGGNITHGSLVQALINGGTDKWFTARLRRTIKNIFSADPRVVISTTSPLIEIYHGANKTEVSMSFQPIDQATEESMDIILEDQG